MSEQTRALIHAHWRLANNREWSQFGQLLDPALLYEVPQTREYIEGGHGYLEMFRTWPGDWQASIKHLVCEEAKAVCVIDFAIGNESMTGISIFEVKGGLITGVTDYWPESYEPPPRATPFMKRRPNDA
jgi:SnoaL-like domain